MANYIHEQSVLNVLRCGEYNTITERVKLWNKTVQERLIEEGYILNDDGTVTEDNNIAK